MNTLILINVTTTAVTIMSRRPFRLSAMMMRTRLMMICNSNCTWIDQFNTTLVSHVKVGMLPEDTGDLRIDM